MPLTSPSRPTLLQVCQKDEIAPLSSLNAELYDILWTDEVADAIALMERQACQGVYFSRSSIAKTKSLHNLIIHEQVLNALPNGVAILDCNKKIEWYSLPFEKFVTDNSQAIEGTDFYKALGSPECLGEELTPLDTALGTGKPTSCSLRWATDGDSEERFARLQVRPLKHTSEGTPGDVRQLLVSLTDISNEYKQTQKLDAIYKAGAELNDVTPEELLQMTVEDRRNALSSNILYCVKQLLDFDRIEVRILNTKTGELKVLLSQGMDALQDDTALYARPTGNGVTGFVASSGNYYLCEDPDHDPYYIQGASGAKTTLTIPIKFLDNVVGTFNVESLTEHAFTEQDIRYLEIFAMQIASSINTLQLLETEKAEVALTLTQSAMDVSAMPIDAICTQASLALNALEHWGPGTKADVTTALFAIDKTARYIRDAIRSLQSKIQPDEQTETLANVPQTPLTGQRILFLDPDESVRESAHKLIGKLGAEVETTGEEKAAQTMLEHNKYDIFFIDIRLSRPDAPDWTTATFLKENKDRGLFDNLTVILVTDFGYDPNHVRVKAHDLGYTTTLLKPFRLDQVENRIKEAKKEQGKSRDWGLGTRD